MNRTEKQEVIELFREKFQKATSAVLTDYSGLKVEEINALRRAFRDAGVEYRVVKNTLMRIALQGTPLEVLAPEFEGTTGIAISFEDPVAAAKIAVEYTDKYKKLEVRSGYLEGKRLDLNEVKALAELPGMDDLRAMLLGVINAPAQKLLAQIQAPGQQIAGVLQAWHDEQTQEKAA